MLACARIGAVHSVVFAGLSSESLRDRVNDAKCQWVVTAEQVCCVFVCVGDHPCFTKPDLRALHVLLPRLRVCVCYKLA